MKNRMRMKRNPLSYLGWLGFLGVFGVMFVPIMIPFLLFFSFFAYSSMIADELFWTNVYRSGFRAFCGGFVVDVTGLLFLIFRHLTANVEEFYNMSITGNSVDMCVWQFNQYSYFMFFFILNMVLMLCIFTISMMKFRRREKKMVKEEQMLESQEV